MSTPTTISPERLARFLDNILPFAQELVEEGHPVNRQLLPAAFERWMTTCQKFIAQDTEWARGALEYITRRTWTEIRKAHGLEAK
jgi:hypothetical protein